MLENNVAENEDLEVYMLCQMPEACENAHVKYAQMVWNEREE